MVFDLHFSAEHKLAKLSGESNDAPVAAAFISDTFSKIVRNEFDHELVLKL